MSHSYKHIPIIKICGESDKKDKRFSNRKLRKAVKQNMRLLHENTVLLREVSDIWAFNSDGKRFARGLDKKYMRK